MVMGRLREHDREDIAVKLLDWAQLESSLNLCAFCMGNQIVPQKLSQWAKDDEYFRLALDFAKCCIGARREQALRDGRLHVKSYDLNARVYDAFLKEEYRDEIRFKSTIEAEAKLGAEEVSRKDFKEGLDRLMHHFASSRSEADPEPSSDIPMDACNNKISECKS